MNPLMTAVILLACLLIFRHERNGNHLAAGRPGRLAADLCTLLALGLLLLPRETGPGQSRQAADLTLAVAIDVSRSMGADAGGVSRLDLVRQDLAVLLQELPAAKVALVPFAGVPVLQSPPTADHQALRLLLDALQPGQVAAPGSAPEEAVLLARRLLEGTDGKKAVLLYSDGERTLPIPAPEIGPGITVHALLPADERPRPVPGRTVHGKPALSRPDPERLRAIAAATGGRLLRVSPDRPAVDQLPFDHRRPADRTAGDGRWLWAVLLLLAVRYLPGRRRRAGLLTAGLGLVLLAAACGQDREEDGPATLFHRAMQQTASERTIGLFRRAAARTAGEQRATALHNACSDALRLPHPRLAVTLCEQALLAAPGRQDAITNLALALRLPRTPAGQGGREKGAPKPAEDGMRPEQARQLLRSIEVRPGELAPAGTGTGRDIRVERDW